MKAFIVHIVTPSGIALRSVPTEADDPVDAGRKVTGRRVCCADYGFRGTLRAKVYLETEDATWIYRMYEPRG